MTSESFRKEGISNNPESGAKILRLPESVIQRVGSMQKAEAEGGINSKYPEGRLYQMVTLAAVANKFNSLTRSPNNRA